MFVDNLTDAFSALSTVISTVDQVSFAENLADKKRYFAQMLLIAHYNRQLASF